MQPGAGGAGGGGGAIMGGGGGGGGGDVTTGGGGPFDPGWVVGPFVRVGPFGRPFGKGGGAGWFWVGGGEGLVVPLQRACEDIAPTGIMMFGLNKQGT